MKNIDKEELSKEQKFDKIKTAFEENDAQEEILREALAKRKEHEKEFHKYSAIIEEAKKKISENLLKAKGLIK
jgi:hypothetical protein